MAKVYKAVGGKKIQKHMAQLDGVQADLEARTFIMAARAEEALIQHRADGHAEIEVEHGDVDWYVVLSDERGEKAALSIEYGREEYEVEFVNRKTGEKFTRTVGAMDGLFILADATHLPRKVRGKVKL